MTLSISACIIAHDEEQYIGRAITNIKKYVNEVIVVDSGSTDKTVEICESLGCKVFYRKFDLHYGDQRNYALNMCSNNCVVVLDADEYFDDYTLNNLQSLFEEAIKNNIAVYRVPCYTILDEHIVDKSLAARLMQKTAGTWEGRLHEVFVAREGYECTNLPDDYKIYNQKTHKKQLYNNLLYTNIENGIYERPPYNKGLLIDGDKNVFIFENHRNDSGAVNIDYLTKTSPIYKITDIPVEKYYTEQIKDYVLANQKPETFEEKLDVISSKLDKLKRRR